jgi:hypothetical protein
MVTNASETLTWIEVAARTIEIVEENQEPELPYLVDVTHEAAAGEREVSVVARCCDRKAAELVAVSLEQRLAAGQLFKVNGSPPRAEPTYVLGRARLDHVAPIGEALES